MTNFQRLVHVAIPTSYQVQHPSTHSIETTVQGIKKLLPESPVYIYCDWPQDYLTREQRHAYWNYLRRLKRLQLGTLIRLGEWVGLPGIHHAIVHHSRLPLLFNCQHDWKFVQPERIHAETLLYSMFGNKSTVQCVRLSKRLYTKGGGHIDTLLEPVDESLFGVPLLKTSGWSDNPHFATMYHYVVHVMPNMAKTRLPDGSSGVETYVCRAYRRDIKELGFEAAHKRWGVYLYGRLRDFRYIHHLGLDTTTWRCNLGLLPERISGR